MLIDFSSAEFPCQTADTAGGVNVLRLHVRLKDKSAQYSANNAHRDS